MNEKIFCIYCNKDSGFDAGNVIFTQYGENTFTVKCQWCNKLLSLKVNILRLDKAWR